MVNSGEAVGPLFDKHRSLPLSGEAVHVWFFQASKFLGSVPSFQAILSQDELGRATAFRFDHLAEHFTVAHGLLRCVLAQYLPIHPGRLHFIYSSKGKPTLADHGELSFSLSHSDNAVVIGVTLSCALGIDVEKVRYLPDRQTIASHAFCREESSEIESLAPEEREMGFFRCWTRKEAYVKAIGCGLSTPFKTFRVSVHPTYPARVVHISGSSVAAAEWQLHDLDLLSGYASALAYHGPARHLTLFSPEK